MIAFENALVSLDELVARWQWRLGLTDWYANREAISAFQVAGEDGVPGRELVGVVIDWPVFTIVHTRPLTEHDVVHELLHVAFSHWDHGLVERWTDILTDNQLTDNQEAVERIVPSDAVNQSSQEENIGKKRGNSRLQPSDATAMHGEGPRDSHHEERAQGRARRG